MSALVRLFSHGRAWLAAAWLLVACAGCLSENLDSIPSATASKSWTITTGCPEDVLADCESTNADGKIRVRLSNFSLQGHGSPGAGIHIVGPVDRLELSDFVVGGFSIAILWEVTNCRDCVIEVRRGVLEADTALRGRFGILVENPAASVHGLAIQVSDVTIRNYDSALVTSGHEAQVVFRNVHVLAGTIITVGAREVEMENVSIHGNRDNQAIKISARHVILVDVEVANPERVGIYSHSEQFKATGLNITGAGFWGARIGSQHILIRDSRFSNNEVGGLAITNMGLSSNSTIANSTFTGNGLWGLSAIASINAPENYWGSANGPRVRPLGNPGIFGLGSGDGVTEYVRFAPWKAAP